MTPEEREAERVERLGADLERRLASILGADGEHSDNPLNVMAACLIASRPLYRCLEHHEGCDGCDMVMASDALHNLGLSWAVEKDHEGVPVVQLCPACALDPTGEEPW